MKGETHVTIGVAVTMSLMTYGIMEPAIVPIAATAIASLLPDIDHNKASINVRLGINKGAYIILAAVLIYYVRTPQVYIAAAILVAVGLSRHRAITHSLLAMIVLFLVTIQLDVSIRMGLLVGYGAHLLSDFFTKQGIEVFYPNKKNYKAPVTISTGKMAENFVWSIAVVVVIFNGAKFLRLI